MQNKDYWRYDYLNISVKRENAQELVSSYEVLGWKELSFSEDKVYGDILHYSFFRERQIKNKDRLQYLQVGLERGLNARAILKRRAHDFSTTLLCFFGVLATLAFIFSVYFFMVGKYVFFWLGALISLITAIGGVLLCLFIREKENKRCKNKVDELLKEREEIFTQILLLTGVNNE